VCSLKEPHSLYSTERFSPVRRLSEGNTAARTVSVPSSTEQSPCEIQAIQDEYRQLNQETRMSIDSSSSGYHSPQYLCPPTPPASQVSRRCSETDNELMAAMYEEMYSSSGRRSSYPNSPSHGSGGREKQSLTHHLQKLCLQQRMSEASRETPSQPTSVPQRFKGSITQGLPSLAAITTSTTQTFNEALNQQIKLSLWGSNYAPTTDDFLQIPVDATTSYSAQNPEISVTNVMGDEVKLVLTERMDEG